MRLALALGSRVLLSDKKGLPRLVLPFTENDKIIDLRPRQDPKILSQYSLDLLVLAPGLPPQLEIIAAARRRGLSILSENDFGFKSLLEVYQQRKRKQPFVIGITGTDGKSTTTALLTDLINKSTKNTQLSAISCGNFGLPLSELAWDAQVKDIFYDVLVVECSSFQLETLEHFHPQIALFLNLAKDHSDRYADLQDYFQSKLRITKLQNEEDLLILSEKLRERVQESQQRQNTKAKFPRLFVPSVSKNQELGKSQKRGMGAQEDTFYFAGEALLAFSELKLPGVHNISNVAFALAGLEELSRRASFAIQSVTLRATLRAFKGLAHRLEYVKSMALSEFFTISFYNDSKATTVQAVKAALQSLADKHIFLLCGGRSKGDDFSALAGVDLALGIDIFPFGEAGPEIAEQIKEAPQISSLKLHVPSPNLESAFGQVLNNAENYAKEQRSSADNSSVILLSPACSSLDTYDNYAQRGEHFCQLVYQYAQESRKI